MHALADFVKEYTSTTGTGLSLTLTGAVPGFARFSDATNITNNTTVYYCIKNGSNREQGVGTWKTGNLLERTTPAVTFVDGAYDDSTPAKIDLVGLSEVGIIITSTVFESIFVDMPLTGTPTAPTAAAGTNTTQVATTAFVRTEYAAPPAIGATTPAAGSFTTLSATGAITYGGVTLTNAVTGTGNMVLSASPTFTGVPVLPTAAAGTNTTQGATTAFVLAEYAAPPAIGNTTPAAGTFTTLTANTNLVVAKTITAPATTGAQTIDKTAGSVNFAAAAASLVVTNSLVTANSLIFLQLYGAADTTMTDVTYTATAGSFTILANAAATAETRVNFLVVN